MGQNIVAPWIYYIPNAQTVIPQPIPPTVKTRLGLVGETLTGPAFQPTLIKTNTEFTSIFGSYSTEKDGITNFPRYELPYIANSFLNYSKGLFVTRVLGFSGYDAGHAWAITLKANYDYTTIGPTITGGSYSTLFSFTANSQGTIINLVSNDSLVQTIWDNDLFFNTFYNLPGQLTGATDSNYTGGTLNEKFRDIYDLGTSYTGLGISNFYLNSYVYDSVNDTYYGSTSGVTTYFSASTYSDVSNQVVAVLRSRATYGGNEILNFRLSGGTTSLQFDTNINQATNNVYGNFSLKWTESNSTTGSTVLSFDKTNNNYIATVLNNNTSLPIYVDEIYDNIIRNLNSDSKIRGVNLSLVDYSKKLSNYKQKYSPSVTPWVVSQIKGSNISKLFRFWTVGDGVYTTNLLKITIFNIRLANSQNTQYNPNKPDEFDDYKFDVAIRSIDNPDTSFAPFVDELFTTCSMNPKSNDYIAKRIGTRNGDYSGTSKYVTVEMNEDDENNFLTFPAGFLGYPIANYEETQSGTAVAPFNIYKKEYNSTDNVNVTYLGLSDSYGYDKSMFKYKGKPNNLMYGDWSGMTKGYHMDINATGATIDTDKVTIDGINYYLPDFQFEVGNTVFDDEQNVINTPYQSLTSRKFTLMPYGGFDGWDIHRITRTNTNRYGLNGDLGILGERSGNFKTINLTNNKVGLTSDYYAFLEGIWTFKNTDYMNINLFATPGLDVINHNDLIEAGIDMIEHDRADSLYIVTTPDITSSGETIMNTQDIVGFFDSTYDTTYAATYWPWVQVSDPTNNTPIFLPPTISVVTNMAKNDNTPGIELWDATAGVSRGDISVLDIRKDSLGQYLSKVDIDYLYNNRINPIIKIDLYQDPVIYTGFKIWGNKTLSTSNYLTNRVNVRRLLLEIKLLITNVCKRYLFEPNDTKVRKEIQNAIMPLLKQLKDRHGISEFKLVFDTTNEMIDKGYLTGKLYLKPVKALEYIVFAFSMQSTDAGFAVEFNQE